MDHQALEDSDMSLIDRWSTYYCLDCRIESTTLFLIFLNLLHNLRVFCWVAFLYALLRFRIILLIAVVIQGGSDGLIHIVLFGTHSAERAFI